MEPAPTADIKAIRRSLERLAGEAGQQERFLSILPHLAEALGRVSEPARVLDSLELLSQRFEDPLHVISILTEQPRAVEILVRLFSSSQFLTEIVLRNPGSFERLLAYQSLARPKSVERIYTEIQDRTADSPDTETSLGILRRYQSEELLRIGACDILDLYDLPAVTRQLSNLADGLIRACLKLSAAQAGASPEELIVLGMGKLGGRELNYSSDIDLLFLTNTDPQTAQRLGERLIDSLARMTPDGFLYRVDMRLRPWGRVGPLITTLPGYLAYLQKNARLWEKQALLKARPIAGDTAAGRSFLADAQPILFGSSVSVLQNAVFSMKQRTEDQLRQNGRFWGEVKLGEGSIRDIEFTVQFLQLAYGADQPEILSPTTLDALVRLVGAGRLRQDEYRMLSEGYVFLRTIEHYLQMMDYRQTHSLPDNSEAMAALARRLGFGGPQPGLQFLEQYQQRCAVIRAVFLRYVGGSEMAHPFEADSSTQPQPNGSSNPMQVHRHLDRMAPSYAEVFTPEQIERHAALASRLGPDNPAEVDPIQLEDGTWQVSVVAYDFPGEYSVLTGLLFIYGLNILSGEAFTYEPLREETEARVDTRRKIVDVFVVRPVTGIPVTLGTWVEYTTDLARCHLSARTGQRQAMQGDLTRRVALALQRREPISNGGSVPTLYPIHIEIDNEANDEKTLLRIDAQDTPGFLYELTNALAISGVYIDQVVIDTIGNRVQDVLFVTDTNGRKITDPVKQQELRVATVLIKHFSHLLPFSPNPESALVHFRDFIDQLFHRSNWTSELASVQRPEVLRALAHVLGVSDFLWDDFLRMQYTNLFPVVTDTDALDTAKSRADLQWQLGEVLGSVHAGPQKPIEDPAWIDALTSWRDREMFRIDMRHLLGHTREFWDFASELSDLAEVVSNATFHLCHEDLRNFYGTPLQSNDSPSQMCVLGLGKFGGRELGFASDIELMFIYDENGKTSGSRSISTAEFYEKLVENYVSAMRARREGIFQVDLQLRPYGKAGSMAVSLESFRRYFAPGGPAWAYERQALVKMRCVAGDETLGSLVTGLRDDFVYTGEPFDVTAMRAMRERQIRHLTHGSVFNVKYSLGGLVDIEYLVQGLQITHGKDHPELRQANTRDCIMALRQVGVLDENDYNRLRRAYTFLRWFIDSLRVVRGNAKDITTPAENSEEFSFLARRMRYGEDTARLRQDLIDHTAAVREINRRLMK